MARCWYAYNGIGDPLLCSSYNLASHIPACLNGCNVCAIYAPRCGPQPSCPLSNNMRNYIANLQITCVAQPDSTPGIKKYVYGKFL